MSESRSPMKPPADIDALFPGHLATVAAGLGRAMDRLGVGKLVIHAGSQRRAFLDDQTYPYRPNPWFNWLVPVRDAPDSLILWSPGRRPRLILVVPDDYWHRPPERAIGSWVEQYELETAPSAAEALARLPAPGSGSVWLGEPDPPAVGYAVNPPALLHELEDLRTRKTGYEARLHARGDTPRRSRSSRRPAVLPGRRQRVPDPPRLPRGDRTHRGGTALRQHRRAERERRHAALPAAAAGTAGSAALAADRRRRKLPGLCLGHHAHLGSGPLRRLRDARAAAGGDPAVAVQGGAAGPRLARTASAGALGHRGTAAGSGHPAPRLRKQRSRRASPACSCRTDWATCWGCRFTTSADFAAVPPTNRCRHRRDTPGCG